MGWLSWIVFGLIAGIIARVIVPGSDSGGFLWTIVIGIVGAFVGGFIGTQIGWGDVTSFDLKSMGIAVLGAIVFLVLWRAAT